MKSTFFTLAALSLSALALPKPDRRAVDDATVLNYALTLEHLENAFYHDALAKFDENAFASAGLPSWARQRFSEVAAHEAAHVAFLTSALGDKATKPCEYSFPYTDPKSFAAVSQILEGVGVSAYAGAAQFIQNKDYLTAAAVVLSTEARHASWVAAAVNKHAGWSGALDVPLSLNQVYSLAAPFIKSCPPNNPALPVKAFPALTFTDAKVSPGKEATVKYDAGSAKDVNIAFFTGLSQKFAPVKNNKVTVPADLVGTVYAVVTTSNDKATDDNIVAGPAILQFETNSRGEVV